MVMRCSTGYVRVFLATFLLAVGALSVFPQSNKGTISPVESDDDAPPKPVLHYYDKHGERLDTPVLYLAELDTATAVRPKSPYPLFNGITVGVNFADAIMSAIGQKHSSYDISAMVSLHNWFFPIVEAGIGWGNHTDNNNIFKEKAYPSMYAKVGINYNFLYKSDPAYMAYLGLRFGVAQCRWDKIYTRSESSRAFRSDDEETVGDGSSEEEVKPASDEIDQRCTSIYGEILAGLKVKIVGPFSLGWTVRYRLGLHHSGGMSPWFVPGYGTGPIGFTFNAYLTFGQKKKKDPELPIAISEEYPN
ncbi:MAG: hypothetical protein K2L11_00185 [Muribaculaceae bacterium]|nr:hypothetical protein [Muribaculaceae bacterium]